MNKSIKSATRSYWWLSALLGMDSDDNGSRSYEDQQRDKEDQETQNEKDDRSWNCNGDD